MLDKVKREKERGRDGGGGIFSICREEFDARARFIPLSA